MDSSMNYVPEGQQIPAAVLSPLGDDNKDLLTSAQLAVIAYMVRAASI